MKFGTDWRGVFLRGDDAFAYAAHLRRIVKHAEAVGAEPISRLTVAGLATLLESADERVPTDETQHMRPYGEALVKDDAVEPMREMAELADSAEPGPSVEFDLGPEVLPQRDHEQAADRSEVDEPK